MVQFIHQVDNKIVYLSLVALLIAYIKLEVFFDECSN